MAQIYPSESMTDESLVSAGAVFGMIAGQLIFGAAGDFLGRQFALCCTLLVCLVGAMGSAFLTFDSGAGGADIFKQLLYWRVLLGVGAGGVYPLAATLARASSVGCCARATLGGDGSGEAGGGEYTDTGSTAVALMFSMQGVGYLAAHVTGYIILSILPGSSPVAWRLLLGLGAVLPLGLVISLALAFSRARRYGLVQSALDGDGGDVEDVGGAGRQGGDGRRRRREGGGEQARSSSNPLRMWLALRNKRRLLSKLVGTAGSWFLFDVTFYGNQLVRHHYYLCWGEYVCLLCDSLAGAGAPVRREKVVPTVPLYNECNIASFFRSQEMPMINSLNVYVSAATKHTVV